MTNQTILIFKSYGFKHHYMMTISFLFTEQFQSKVSTDDIFRIKQSKKFGFPLTIEIIVNKNESEKNCMRSFAHCTISKL